VKTMQILDFYGEKTAKTMQILDFYGEKKLWKPCKP
jgi:hypothetical protein